MALPGRLDLLDLEGVLRATAPPAEVGQGQAREQQDREQRGRQAGDGDPQDGRAHQAANEGEHPLRHLDGAAQGVGGDPLQPVVEGRTLVGEQVHAAAGPHQVALDLLLGPLGELSGLLRLHRGEGRREAAEQGQGHEREQDPAAGDGVPACGEEPRDRDLREQDLQSCHH